MSRKPWFDTALICLNGHLITLLLDSNPQEAASFCDQCGLPTISQCPKCQAKIRGYYHIPGAVTPPNLMAPAYCHACGAPYPWTEQKLEAARGFIALANIDDTEKQALSSDLPNLMNDTPRTKVAATRFRLFLQRAGQELGSGFRDLLVEMASEAAKKILFGP